MSKPPPSDAKIVLLSGLTVAGALLLIGVLWLVTNCEKLDRIFG